MRNPHVFRQIWKEYIQYQYQQIFFLIRKSSSWRLNDAFIIYFTHTETVINVPKKWIIEAIFNSVSMKLARDNIVLQLERCSSVGYANTLLHYLSLGTCPIIYRTFYANENRCSQIRSIWHGLHFSFRATLKPNQHQLRRLLIDDNRHLCCKNVATCKLSDNWLHIRCVGKLRFNKYVLRLFKCISWNVLLCMLKVFNKNGASKMVKFRKIMPRTLEARMLNKMFRLRLLQLCFRNSKWNPFRYWWCRCFSCCDFLMSIAWFNRIADEMQLLCVSLNLCVYFFRLSG